MGTTKTTRQMAFQEIGKIPPQAIDLEECVLGAMLIDKEAVPIALDILTKEAFYKDQNALIFEAIASLFNKGKGIDIELVVEELKLMGSLDEVGGRYGVAILTNKVFSSAHIEHHALIVKQKYIRRMLITLGSTVCLEAYDDTVEDLDVLSNHEKSLSELTDKAITGEAKSLTDILTQVLSYKKEDIGVPVIMAGLKTKLKNFQNSDFIVLAARPSMGKTAYALQLAKETAEQGIPVGVFSLEMSSRQLVTRLLTSETGIEYNLIANKELSEYENLKVLEASKELSYLPIHIDDSTGLNEVTLRAKAMKMKRKHGIGLIVLDYLQLMSGSGKTNNREQEISQISRKLKQIAKELDIPVIALSQLSRKCEERSDKKPMLSDLRESGAIEQDADCVIFLYRPEYYSIKEIEKDGMHYDSHGICEAIVAKSRNGKTGSCFAHFHGQAMKFLEFDNFVETKKAGIFI